MFEMVATGVEVIGPVTIHDVVMAVSAPTGMEWRPDPPGTILKWVVANGRLTRTRRPAGP